MIYYCNDCKLTFDSDRAGLIADRSDDMYDRGTVPMMTYVCPCCGGEDIEEATEKQICSSG